MWLYLCSVLLIWDLVKASPLPKKYQLQNYEQKEAVKKFQEYIRIDTSQEENLKYAVEFWRRQANEIGLPFAVYRPAGKPVCVITWEGLNPYLPSIMLNSHMDVVPAVDSDWKYPPYSGYIDEDGNIYGRGTQDTKDIAIQYLEAIRRLKSDNVTLQRTFHITLMPDEETGGKNGMIAFIDTPEYEALNIGFALDEGIATEDDSYLAFYEDRRPWMLQYKVHGNGGHAMVMPDGTAIEKAQYLINTIMEYREQQKQIMKTKDKLDYGGFTSININVIHGGNDGNVIAKEITLIVDIRLATTVNASELWQLVNKWAYQAGNDTELTSIRLVTETAPTSVGDDNPYWVALREAINEIGGKLTPVVCPAASDMIALRKKGIPAIGFAPKTYTTPRVHNSNEYLNMVIFLKGIDVYRSIIQKLGNLQT